MSFGRPVRRELAAGRAAIYGPCEAANLFAA